MIRSMRVVAILITLITAISSLCSGQSVVCITGERHALLSFKQDLTDPSKRLSSWTREEDCCKWSGVVCDNLTGHVLELHLRNHFGDYETSTEYEAYRRSQLGGTINPSLLSLRHLSYVDLSGNGFTQIPKFLGSLKSLRHLNLSEAEFGGLVPHQLGNLSNLEYLNLGRNDGMYVDNLQWLSGLSSLQHLDLSSMNLSKSSNWLQVTNSLPSLIELRLRSCELQYIPPLPHVNFTSLVVLDLSSNSFYSLVPDWMYSLGHLEILNLSYNNFHGTISSSIGNLTSLTSLNLASNNLQGGLPKFMGQICSLRKINLSGIKLEISEVKELLSRCILDGLEKLALDDNQLSGQLADVIDHLAESKHLYYLSLDNNSFFGSIPESLGRLASLTFFSVGDNRLTGALPVSLGQLAMLEELSVPRNFLNGVVSEVHFDNLTRLRKLSATGNPLFLNFSPNWIPPFQLFGLQVRSCQSWSWSWSRFPQWLRSQKSLLFLDISNTGINDTIPTWFWEITSRCLFLNLSNNQLHGEIPNLALTREAIIVDISANRLEGPLPQISSGVSCLVLSNNLLTGSLSNFLCYKMGEPKRLEFLHLKGNLLSGEIPDCWMSWQSLKVVNLRNNNLTGNVPISFGSLRSLQSLHLRNNCLSGEIPVSLQNSTGLISVDLGENKFVGSIPIWMGERLPNLKILILRSNSFSGSIPYALCALTSLQILDLASNNLSGTIPRCFNNFTAMTKDLNSNVVVTYQYDGKVLNGSAILTVKGSYLKDNAVLVMKGQVLEYSTTLGLVTGLDLSDNHFSGEIPVELTCLLGLRSLNLSRNLLTGKIPEDIGNMVLLESIDFSINKLSGEIPPTMSSLAFLSHLNLSHNNFMGKIPSGTQLQSFNESSFVGNHLCGPPLTEKCSTSREIPDVGTLGQKGDGPEVDWFYVSMALGFVVGFWAIVGPLLFNKSWRFVYFQFLESMGHKLRLY
ncbi:receptor-like protein EIX1 [Actinidia eriantha]|uniref:receptor-like protein EIX1 n=1 Tax=Actinidia eriantha TaxID=165200 RepID=UPI00258285EA|nr:receptor-like protein EIX1 [Actinidia eriantha]